MPVTDENPVAAASPPPRPAGSKKLLPGGIGSLMGRAAQSPLAGQFLSFTIVGIPTTIVHYAVLIALVEIWHVHPVVGTTAGFAAAALLSYYLNRRYTFDARPQFGIGLARYYAILSVGLVLNALIVAGLMHVGLSYIFAQVIATGLVLIWNFLAARFFVFHE